MITLERGAKPDFGFGKVCWEYRRAPGTAPVRFCFDLGGNSPA